MGSNLLVVLAATTFFGAVGSPEEGIIAHYSFEEGQGSVAQDDSGRNHHGQIQGQPSRATGPWGTALRLDGQEGFVAAGPETDFSLDRAGSILFWHATITSTSEMAVVIRLSMVLVSVQ